MTTLDLEIPTPRWALPLLQPARYKGAHGGRGSGKSHQFAGMLVEDHVADPDLRSVCIREVQRSLKFSAKSLIEAKIRDFGVSDMFDIKTREIRDLRGTGVIIFEGMQDHTADSIKSLEDFRRCWVEEAQSISARSLSLLRPTIRAAGSELWFSWNPEDEERPVEFLRRNPPEDAIVVGCSYRDNPFCPEAIEAEARAMQRTDPEAYTHVYLGGYNKRSDELVFSGKWIVDEFEPDPDTWDGPYYGADWGFSQDPTVLVRFWLADNRIWIEHESAGVGQDLQDTPALFDRVPGSRDHRIRADQARPETISHMRRAGFDVIAAPKWSGSVEDGISWIRSHEQVVIHPRCQLVAQEFRLYAYKTDRYTGDPLPKIVDAHNHTIDAIRYGAAPMIRVKPQPGFRTL